MPRAGHPENTGAKWITGICGAGRLDDARELAKIDKHEESAWDEQFTLNS
jgi:hypothetical protein